MVNTHASSAVFAFKRFRVDGRKQSENATCGREFFLKTEKKVAFSNENRYVWAGPYFTGHR